MILNNKGFSMVEIIVAMAILSLVAVSLVTLFSFSATEIFHAGEKSEKIFEAQGEVDNLIESGGDPSYFEEKNVVVEISGEDVEIPGNILEIEYKYNERTGHITYFLPDENN